MKKTSVVVGALSLAFVSVSLSLCASAQTSTPSSVNTPRIDGREALQTDRIEQGMNSGALTPNETARVDRGQARVESGEAAAKADGKVTGHERAALTHAQNHQSRLIHRLKHNARSTTPAV